MVSPRKLVQGLVLGFFALSFAVLAVPSSATAQRTKDSLSKKLEAIREQMEKDTVTLPNPGISVGYSLLGLAAEGYAPDETTTAMTMAIARTQRPDGSFAVLPARPPLEASALDAALGRAGPLWAPQAGGRIFNIDYPPLARNREEAAASLRSGRS